MQKKNIVIFGNGGHAKVVAEVIKQENKFSISHFVVDHELNDISHTNVISEKLLDLSFIKSHKIYGGIIAVGSNTKRREISKKINRIFKNFIFITTVHPTAIISKGSFIGHGTVVMPNALINPDVVIKDHCVINSGCIVEHDCLINSFTSIAPGAILGGSVMLGEESYVGIGAVVSNNLSICKKTILGAGSVTVKSIKKSGVYIGVPSKLDKKVNRCK